MILTPFQAMRAAIDIVGDSLHPTSKIAATLFGATPDGQPFAVTQTNHWPGAIERAFGRETAIGNSSGTLHAEVACLLNAPLTLGMSIALTDPFCPNCAKNMAEAGIRNVYIDHKGFEKDFATRRGGDFTTMSLRIAERAGIKVYEIRRKEGTITPLATPAETYEPPEDRPIHSYIPGEGEFSPGALSACAMAFETENSGEIFAAGWGTGPDHHPAVLITPPHLSIGYQKGSSSDRLEMEAMKDGKYSFIMDPVNRLLMAAARLGVRLDQRLVVSSIVPSSRELVNLVGGGYTRLQILHPNRFRNSASVRALEQLTQAGVVTLT